MIPTPKLKFVESVEKMSGVHRAIDIWSSQGRDYQYYRENRVCG